MTGLKSTATLPRRALSAAAASPGHGANGHGGSANSHGNGNGNGNGNNNATGSADPRQVLLAKAEELNARARHSAEEGDIEASARQILQALDCERRACGLGPQVLQLIKPRG